MKFILFIISLFVVEEIFSQNYDGKNIYTPSFLYKTSLKLYPNLSNDKFKIVQEEVHKEIDSNMVQLERKIYLSNFDFSTGTKNYTYRNYIDFVIDTILFGKPQLLDKVYFGNEWNSDLYFKLWHLKFKNGDSSGYKNFQLLHDNLMNSISKQPFVNQARQLVDLFNMEMWLKCDIKKDQKEITYQYPDPKEFIRKEFHHIHNLFSKAQSQEEQFEFLYLLADLYYKKNLFVEANYYITSAIDNSFSNSKCMDNQYFYNFFILGYHLSKTFKGKNTAAVLGQFINKVENSKDSSLIRKMRIGIYPPIYSNLQLKWWEYWLTEYSPKANYVDYSNANKHYLISLACLQDNIQEIASDNYWNSIDIYSAYEASRTKCYNWQKVKGQIFLEKYLLSKAKFYSYRNTEEHDALLNNCLYILLLREEYGKAKDLLQKYVNSVDYVPTLTELTMSMQKGILEFHCFIETNEQIDSLGDFFNTIGKLVGNSKLHFLNEPILKHNFYSLKVLQYNTIKNNEVLNKQSFQDSLEHYTYLLANSEYMEIELENTNKLFATEYQYKVGIESLNKNRESLILEIGNLRDQTSSIKDSNSFLINLNKSLGSNLSLIISDTLLLGTEKRALIVTVDSLNKDTTRLNFLNKQLNSNIQTLNDEIIYKQSNIVLLTVISALLVIISIFAPIIIYKRRTATYTKALAKQQKENEEFNYKIKLDKLSSEMKLLSNLAINHDIDKFIPTLPLYLKRYQLIDKKIFISVVEKFKEYYMSTKNKRNELYNKIRDEMYVASLSAEVYLYMCERNVDFKILNNFDGNNIIEDIQVPKNLFTSFIANSIKHGSDGKKSITINVHAFPIYNGYEFSIDDDGNGFKSLGLEDKPKDKGINLICSQIENFNEFNEGRSIEFSTDNIVNKQYGKGVIVTFKILNK